MPKHTKKAKGGMRYKAKKGSKLGMVSVETGFDNNPNVTRADVIQGAKKKKGEAKGGLKMKAKNGAKVTINKRGTRGTVIEETPGTFTKIKRGGKKTKTLDATPGQKATITKTKTNLKGNEKTKTRVVGQKRANRMVKSTRRQAAKQDRIALHGMDTSHPQIARYGMKPKMSKMGSKLASDNNYDMLDKQQS